MAPSASSPRLTILGGPRAGQELTLDEAVDNILVGSDPSCRFHIDLPGVSPIHARLWVDWQGLTVYDTGAPEGVYLNDDRVERSATVRNGDILWLGPPGAEDVVMIQCRVPPRAASPEPGHPPAEAVPEPQAAWPAEGALTDTVAFTTDVTPGEAVSFEPEPDSVETVWITPDAAAQAEPAAEAPASSEVEPPVEPEPIAAAAEVELPEPTGADAETVVLAGEPPGGEFVPPELEGAEEPVKFEIDEPPEALSGRPAVFEEDIEEPQAVVEQVPTVHAVEPPPETLVVPAPEPPPTPVARVPAAPVPRAPRPAPRTAPPRPAPAPARAAARRSSSAGLYVGLAVVALLVLGVGGFAAYRFLLAPAGPAVATPPPSTAAPAPPVTMAQGPAVEEPAVPSPEPSAPVEEAVTIVPTPPPAAAATPLPATPSPKATPTPRATPSARPAAPSTTAPAPEVTRQQQVAAQVAAFVAQGDAALGEHRYDAAAAAYAQALQLDPQNAQASAGRTRALAGAAAARRTFVAGRSQLVGAKSDKKGPAGFEDEDVRVAKAPDYSGRLEFEASPRSLKPGDSYSVRIFLVNDGKKDFKIAALAVVTSTNGTKSGGPTPPATREVATQKRELLHEASGVWQDGTTAWSLEAAVTATHGEVVRNTLSWK